MASSSYLISKKNSYINCYNKVDETCKTLKIALSTTNTTMDNQRSAYTIDGDSGDGGKLYRIKEKEEKILSNITKNIIPRTKSAINRLNNDIEEALEEEQKDTII